MCWPADPGGETTGRTGCNTHCTFQVIKLGICWQGCYLLPPSFSVEEILSQHKKEGAMRRDNVKTQLLGHFYSSPHLRRRGGKSSLFTYSWVNYLSPSCVATDMIFETSKCDSDRDRQTQPCSFGRLPFVISLCVWSLERVSGIFDVCLRFLRFDGTETWR